MPQDLNILIFGGNQERYKNLKEKIVPNIKNHHFLIPCQDIFLASTLMQRYKINGIIANVDKSHQIEVFRAINANKKTPVVMIGSNNKSAAVEFNNWIEDKALGQKNYLQLLESMITGKGAIKQIIPEPTKDLYKEYNLKEIIQSMVKNLNNLFKKKIHLKLNMLDSINLTLTNYNVIFGALSELIDNTFSHSNANLITVDVFQEDNSLFFAFSDNGMGVKKFRSKKIGNGIDTLKANVKAINGRIRFTSKSLSGYHCKIILNNTVGNTKSLAA